MRTSMGIWNFGPDVTQARTADDVAKNVEEIWGASTNWESDSEGHPHEANLLLLNSEKVSINLGWNCKMKFENQDTLIVAWAGIEPAT